MQNRPKIKIEPTKQDRIISIITLILFVASIAFTFYLYSIAPPIVAMHYDLNGKPDAYGDKASLFILPAIACFVFFILNTLMKYPEIYNYPKDLSEENAPQMYRSGIFMLRILNLGIMTLFMIMEIDLEYASIKTRNLLLSPWVLPVTLVITIGVPMAIGFYNMYKRKD